MKRHRPIYYLEGIIAHWTNCIPILPYVENFKKRGHCEKTTDFRVNAARLEGWHNSLSE